jgi:hypothetical protein
MPVPEWVEAIVRSEKEKRGMKNVWKGFRKLEILQDNIVSN